jgi:hypothetical protein
MHDQDMVELEEKKEKKEKKQKKKKEKGKRQKKSLYARGIYLHHAYFYTLGHGINLPHNNVYIGYS